ncbi:unnamed protein product, partial [Allacma fusca]
MDNGDSTIKPSTLKTGNKNTIFRCPQYQ